jgi:hypothetical protein
MHYSILDALQGLDAGITDQHGLDLRIETPDAPKCPEAHREC